MAAALLAELEAAGLRLTVTRGKLAASGPRSALTPERIATIRAHRRELLVLLTSDVQSSKPPHPQSSLHGVHVSRAGVHVAGLDNATRHRVMGAIADSDLAVRMAQRRHDYRGGALTIVAGDPELAERIASVIRRALGLNRKGANDAAGS